MMSWKGQKTLFNKIQLTLLLGKLVSFLLLCLAINRINLRRSNRNYQFLMPLVTLGYVIIAMIGLFKVSGLTTFFINVVESFVPFVKAFNMTSYKIFAANIMVVTAFAVFKTASLPIVSGISRFFSKTTEIITGKIYYYDSDYKKWFLKISWLHFKKLVKAFYYATLLLAIIGIALRSLINDMTILKMDYYPAFLIILAGEIAFYFDGYTKKEYRHIVLGEDDDAIEIANYGPIQDVYQQIFGDRALFHDRHAYFSKEVAGKEQLYQLIWDKNINTRVLGEYYDKLHSSGYQLNNDYIQASLDLVNGENVVINNLFYCDLGHYIFLPFKLELIDFKKCLVICSRESAVKDVINWLNNLMLQYENSDQLWRVKQIGYREEEWDIGVISPKDFYDTRLLNENKEYFAKVGQVILLEPSYLLANSQISFSILAEHYLINSSINYLILDKNSDGLIDSLSHVLKISITKVYATQPPTGMVTSSFWEADGDYLHHRLFSSTARYLGLGSELAMVAFKYQVDKVAWLSDRVFPVMDMKWVAGQYIKNIAAYTNTALSQKIYDEQMDANSNLWRLNQKDYQFIIVEDEYNNIFESARMFSNRAFKQNYIHVISSNHLLRQYMLDNAHLFLNDAKALPQFVADYVRSERNVFIKLFLMLKSGETRDDEIMNELTLSGYPTIDIHEAIQRMAYKYYGIEDIKLKIRNKEEFDKKNYIEKRFNTIELIEDDNNKKCFKLLSNAYFVDEQEFQKGEIIDVRLYGQIFQQILPGQFINLSGKHYEVLEITSNSGVLLRRASEHIKRRYYRQIKDIEVFNAQQSSQAHAVVNHGNFTIAHYLGDFVVNTSGYLEMETPDNVSAAKRVILNDIPARDYKFKQFITIKLHDSSAKIRDTIVALLQEMFISFFPTNYHYLALATTTDFANSNIKDTRINLKLNGFTEQDCIFVFEDSMIDMGLLETVERNFDRFLQITMDYLLWHDAKLNQADTVEEQQSKKMPHFVEPSEKEGIFKRLSNWLKNIFGGSKHISDSQAQINQNERDVASDAVEQTTVDAVDSENITKQEVEEISESIIDTTKTDKDDIFSENFVTDEISDVSYEEDNRLFGSNSLSKIVDEIKQVEGDDSFAELDEEEDDFFIKKNKLFFNQKSSLQTESYADKHFMLFGFEKIDDRLGFSETLDYLEKLGYRENYMEQARKNTDLATYVENNYDPYAVGRHYCDFCGIELLGGKYEVLKDGRERCGVCSKTAVKTEREVKAIYKEVLQNMQNFFGITINCPVRIMTCNTKKIAKLGGEKFEAAAGFNPRIIAIAKRERGNYRIYLENGAPYLLFVAALAHEITHIWQFLNWDKKQFTSQYGEKYLPQVFEGMAKWAEIQYLILINETEYAKRQEIVLRSKDDEYGNGYKIFLERYPLSYRFNPNSETPFNKKFPL